MFFLAETTQLCNCGRPRHFSNSRPVEIRRVALEDIAKVPPLTTYQRRNAMRRFIVLVGVLALLFSGRTAAAETKVTISDTHLCCGMCLKAVDATLKDMAGVKFKSDQGAKTIEIVADSDDAAQKAIDALATAGFYGKLNNDKLKYKPVASADAAVEKLELTGIHNCCGQCTTAIKKAVTGVSGVSGTNIKARETTFAVEGNFKPGELVKALLDAGFYVQVKK
jgi:copper chaperone CopZ